MRLGSVVKGYLTRIYFYTIILQEFHENNYGNLYIIATLKILEGVWIYHFLWTMLFCWGSVFYFNLWILSVMFFCYVRIWIRFYTKSSRCRDGVNLSKLVYHFKYRRARLPDRPSNSFLSEIDIKFDLNPSSFIELHYSHKVTYFLLKLENYFKLIYYYFISVLVDIDKFYKNDLKNKLDLCSLFEFYVLFILFLFLFSFVHVQLGSFVLDFFMQLMELVFIFVVDSFFDNLIIKFQPFFLTKDFVLVNIADFDYVYITMFSFIIMLINGVFFFFNYGLYYIFRKSIIISTILTFFYFVSLIRSGCFDYNVSTSFVDFVLMAYENLALNYSGHLITFYLPPFFLFMFFLFMWDPWKKLKILEFEIWSILRNKLLFIFVCFIFLVSHELNWIAFVVCIFIAFSTGDLYELEILFYKLCRRYGVELFHTEKGNKVLYKILGVVWVGLIYLFCTSQSLLLFGTAIFIDTYYTTFLEICLNLLQSSVFLVVVYLLCDFHIYKRSLWEKIAFFVFLSMSYYGLVMTALSFLQQGEPLDLFCIWYFAYFYIVYYLWDVLFWNDLVPLTAHPDASKKYKEFIYDNFFTPTNIHRMLVYSGVILFLCVHTHISTFFYFLLVFVILPSISIIVDNIDRETPGFQLSDLVFWILPIVVFVYKNKHIVVHMCLFLYYVLFVFFFYINVFPHVLLYFVFICMTVYHVSCLVVYIFIYTRAYYFAQIMNFCYFAVIDSDWIISQKIKKSYNLFMTLKKKKFIIGLTYKKLAWVSSMVKKVFLSEYHQLDLACL